MSNVSAEAQRRIKEALEEISSDALYALELDDEDNTDGQAQAIAANAKLILQLLEGR